MILHRQTYKEGEPREDDVKKIAKREGGKGVEIGWGLMGGYVWNFMCHRATANVFSMWLTAGPWDGEREEME